MGAHRKYARKTRNKRSCRSAVCPVVEGTRTALEHAGLPARWWCYACKHFCFAQNTAVTDGPSALEHRHNKGQFKGPQLLFGCVIDFKLTPVVGKPGPKFDPKAIPGIFLGYHVLPGGRWQGDYWVAASVQLSVQRRGDVDEGSAAEGERSYPYSR